MNDVAISPDGKTIAAASKDRTVRVFRADTGEVVASLRGHLDFVESVAYSPDGSQLASASGDATIRLWKTADWSAAGLLRGSLDTVRGVAWARDGKSLVGCVLDQQLMTWDLTKSHADQLTIDAGVKGTYSSAFSPDGQRVAVSCFDGSLRMFDAATGTQVKAWDAHPGSSCNFAAFAADGAGLLTCSWDKTARLWNPRTGQRIATLDAQAGISSCAISHDGSHAALSSSGLQVWDVTKVKKLHDLKVDGASPARVAFSHAGGLVASAWSDGLVRVYNPSTGELAVSLAGGKARVEAVAFTEDDQQIVSGDSLGIVRLFPVSGGSPTAVVDTGTRGVEHLAVAGDRIAVGSDLLWIIDRKHGGTVLSRRPLADGIYHLSWSPDGQRIAACSTNGQIVVLK